MLVVIFPGQSWHAWGAVWECPEALDDEMAKKKKKERTLAHMIMVWLQNVHSCAQPKQTSTDCDYPWVIKNKSNMFHSNWSTFVLLIWIWIGNGNVKNMSTKRINKTMILSTRGWRTEDSGDARFYRAVNKALLYIRVLQVLQISL